VVECCFVIKLMHLIILVCRHFNEVDSSLREGTWDNLLQGTKHFITSILTQMKYMYQFTRVNMCQE